MDIIQLAITTFGVLCLILAINFVSVPNADISSPSSARISSIALVCTGGISL